MIRVALVGTGFIAEVHATAICATDGLELVGVVERTPRQPPWGARWGVPTCRTLAQVVDQTRPDLVVVTAPAGAHLELASEALELGCTVVLEKPGDTTLERVDRLLAVEAAHPGQVAVISQHRFDPAAVRAAELVAAGELGRVTSASASTPWWRTEAYFRSSPARGTWSHDGGGALMNQGIHAVDLLVSLVGQPVEVFAWTSRLAHDLEVEDTAVGVIRFAGGALGTLHATTAAYPGLAVSIGVLGSRGSLLLEDHHLRYLHLASAAQHDLDPLAREISLAQTNQVEDLTVLTDRGLQVPDPEALGAGHARQYAAIVAALRTGDVPPVPLATHRTTLAVVLGLYESARSGRPTRLG